MFPDALMGHRYVQIDQLKLGIEGAVEEIEVPGGRGEFTIK
jgi:hypothetical protein